MCAFFCFLSQTPLSAQPAYTYTSQASRFRSSVSVLPSSDARGSNRLTAFEGKSGGNVGVRVRSSGCYRPEAACTCLSKNRSPPPRTLLALPRRNCTSGRAYKRSCKNTCRLRPAANSSLASIKACGTVLQMHIDRRIFFDGGGIEIVYFVACI